MSEHPANDDNQRSRLVSKRAGKVAFAYMVFATLWICFSDHALNDLLANPELPVRWSIVKGLAFVAVTSLLLLLMMRRTFGTIEAGYASLKAKELERQAHEIEILRISRMYAALSQVNQAIVWTPDRDELLVKVCRVLVEFGEFRMAWIGWHSAENRELLPVAVSGDETGYLDCIKVYTDDRPEARGPTGTAFREDHYQICNDMLETETLLPWRQEFERRGYRASAAFPIRMNGVVCGVLTVYADVAGFFQDKEVALLEEAALDISFAMDNCTRADEHRKVENALRASEERYRTTLDSMMEGCQIVGFDWRYLYLNEAAAIHNRRPNADLLGKRMSDAWPGIGESVAFGPLRRSMELRVADHHETDFVFPDGSSGWFDVRCHPIPEGIFILSIDITERKKMESFVRESEQRFRQLAESVNEVFWLTDPAKNEILYVSPAYEKIWGSSCRELYDFPGRWLEAVHSDDREQVTHSVMTRQTRGEYDEIYRILRPDGTIRWVHDRAFPIFNDEGKVYRLAGTAVDVTESKLAAMELARSNRALRMLSECCEALTRITDEGELIQDVCRLAVEIGGYQVAWVGYAADDAGRSIFPMAHAGSENGYFSEIKLTWADDDPISKGPGGRTIKEGKVVVCRDIKEESEYFHWRKQALEHGCRSVICLPLRDDDHTFGLLSLHSGEVSDAGADEIKLLQDLADDLAFGIVNIRSQIDRRRMESAMLKVAASVSASADERFFMQLCLNMAEALGAEAGFIARFLPGPPLAARTIAAVAGGKAVENFEYLLDGHPCGGLLGPGDLCVVPCGMPEVFPNVPEFSGMSVQALVGHRLTNSTGQVVGFIAVFFKNPLKDVDFVSSTLRIFATRAAAELERLESDARILEQASLLDRAQDAIIVRGLDHRILYWNRSAERLYGWSASEAVGRNIKEMLYASPDAFLAATRATLDSGEWVGEIEQLTKDRQSKVVEGRWSLVHDSQGNPKSILAINTDITGRKLLERQFLRAQRMESIGTLAGGIAHDLNNVLAPIMMSIDLLRTYINNPSGEEVLNLVGASARRGAEMVGQVLAFARGVEGRSVVVDVSQVVGELVRIIEDTFPKNIRVETTIHPDLWTIKGDPTQLHQVLLNLCVNSRDAMPDGGLIRLTLGNFMIDGHYAAMNIDARLGPHVMIEVEDSGHGIPKEIIDQLFDPFFTTKEAGKGTGLGLSTSQAIVKSHGGFIRVTSEPGAGARFQLVLPADVEVCVASDHLMEEILPLGHGETLLVVDDENSIRQITRQTLEAFGYKVILAADGSEAIAAYVAHQDEISLVITDMMMPVMDGQATLQVLRRLNPSVKIIGVSGIGPNGRDSKAENTGFTRFLRKPYTAEQLLAVIRSVLVDEP